MKNQKGITLVALVITIIVLLILAGVSISLVIGNNGVLTQASKAVETNDKATALQEVQMAAADAVTAYHTAKTTDANAKRSTQYSSTVFTNNCTGVRAEDGLVITYSTDLIETNTTTNAKTLKASDTGYVKVVYTSKANHPYTFFVNVADGSVSEAIPKNGTGNSATDVEFDSLS